MNAQISRSTFRKSARHQMAWAIPALVLAVGNVLAAGSAPEATTGPQKVVTMSSGKYRCPVAAFANDKVDTSLCTLLPANPASTGANGTQADKEDADAPSVVCIPTNTSGSTATGTTSGTAGSTTQPVQAPQKCAVPSALRDTGNLGLIPGRCNNGGDRTVAGGYDAATGKLDLTITLKNCVDQKGATHNGTAVMQGTLTLKTGTKDVYLVNDSKTIMDAVTFANGSKLTRTCTLTRVGEYDTTGNIFKGKSTRNDCVLDGQFRFKDGLVDSLIENASEVEEF